MKRRMKMPISAVIGAAILPLTVGASSNGLDPDETRMVAAELSARCSEDRLTAEEARGRINWSYLHHREEVARFYSLATKGDADFVKHFGGSKNAAERAALVWLGLINEQGGCERRKVPIHYPLWASGPPGKETLWRAPTDQNAPPDKPANVHIFALCVASDSHGSAER